MKDRKAMCYVHMLIFSFFLLRYIHIRCGVHMFGGSLSKVDVKKSYAGLHVD